MNKNFPQFGSHGPQTHYQHLSQHVLVPTAVIYKHTLMKQGVQLRLTFVNSCS